jgi:polyisoprenoid-binding protein YceI
LEDTHDRSGAGAFDPHDTWQVDVVHSSVGFEVPYMGTSTFSGTVESFQATLADGTLTGSARSPAW